MFVYFAGAEIPDYQDRLQSAGVTRMALSFKRIDERPGEDVVRDECMYWLDHGISGSELDDATFDSYLERYIEWAQAHRDQLTGVLEFDVPNPQQRSRARGMLSAGLGSDKVFATWSVSDDVDDLKRTAAMGCDGLVVIGNELHKHTQAMSLLSTMRASGAQIHVHMAPNPERVARIRPTSVSTMSWNAPLRFGELITPRGGGIQRFQPPHDKRTLAIVAERAESLGLNGEAIRGESMEEATLLAIATLQRFQDTDVVTNSLDDEVGPTEELGLDVVDNTGSEVRKTDVLATTLLPGISFASGRHEETGDDGMIEVRDVPVMQTGAESFRKCDTCYLSAACPAYIPGNACAFHLPVELRTKTQVKALMDTMLEIQTARVAFGRFAEEVNGGYPDPTVGKEMDRLMKMVQTKTEMEQSKESLTLSVEAKSAGGTGILSSLFGQRAERLDRLPNGGYSEEQTNVIMGEIAQSMDDS